MYAIKRLTHSDLTFFKSYFQKATGSKQKAINLDAVIFAQLFYPNLSRSNLDRPSKLLFDLRIIGPNAAQGVYFARKAILQAKNWRLNGELVDDDTDPKRFSILSPDDLAILKFSGEPYPDKVDLVILSHSGDADRQLISFLEPLLGNNSMVSVDEADLTKLLAALSEKHPASDVLPDLEFDLDLEDASFGAAVFDDPKPAKEGQPPKVNFVSSEQLRKAKIRAEQIGVLGEELIASWLASKLEAGEITGFEHIAASNAVSPFDFEIVDSTGETSLLDVKTTTGGFSRKFHISHAEARKAAFDTQPYFIYRVFELEKSGHAQLCISEDISAFAKEILKHHLPEGVTPDSYSVSPSAIKWSPSMKLD